MSFRMILASLKNNRFQKLLIALTFILSTLLLSAMLNITLGIGNEVAKELRSFGSNIVVLPKGASLSIEVDNSIYTPLANQSFIEESKLPLIKEIFWRNSIIAFAPFLDIQTNIQTPNGTSFHAILSGSYFDKNLGLKDEPEFNTGLKHLYPLWNINGEWADDNNLNTVMIGTGLATQHNLSVGDSITLVYNDKHYDVTITGLIEKAGAFDDKIVAPLALVQSLDNKPNAFFKAEVSALTIPENSLSQKARTNVDSLSQVEFDSWYCSAFVSSIAYQIEEDLKGTSAKPQLAISDAESAIVKKIQNLMAIVSLIALIAAVVSVGSLLSAELERRRAEIALQKVLGASTSQLYLLFASETLIIGILGAILGFFIGQGIGQGIAWLIFEHFLPFSWIALPLCIAFAVIITLFASLFLIRSITELPPARVLYGR